MSPCFICGSDQVCRHREPSLLPVDVRGPAIKRQIDFCRGYSHGETSYADLSRRDQIKVQLHAQKMVHRAIKAGLMKRPQSCEKCGVNCVPEGHHFDYDQPLRVMWLCRKCHCKEDRTGPRRRYPPVEKAM